MNIDDFRAMKMYRRGNEKSRKALGSSARFAEQGEVNL
jgi:hypothetical protein